MSLTTDKVTLQEFYDLLDKHDWYYMMSDDNGVERKGSVAMVKLGRIAQQSPAHTELLAQFHQFHWTGKPWNTEQAPKPKRPV